MTIEELRKALEKITENDPISIARRQAILEQIYALQMSQTGA